MQCFPNPVPDAHGVYIIVHRASNSLYVGSSVNLRGRYMEWRTAFKHRSLNHWPSKNPDEYEFRVAKQMSDVDVHALRTEEDRIIDLAKSKNIKLINKLRPGVKIRYEMDGLVMSAAAHATRLGMNASTVVARVHRGYTLAEAVDFENREQAMRQMPVVLIDTDGNKLTYKEAAAIRGIGIEGMKSHVKRARARNPDLKELRPSAARSRCRSG